MAKDTNCPAAYSENFTQTARMLVSEGIVSTVAAYNVKIRCLETTEII